MPEIYVPSVQVIALDRFEKNDWNVNEMDLEAFQRLCGEIKEVGFIDFPQAVPLDTGKYRIVGGEHRIEAARALGMEGVPTIVLSGAKWKEADLQKFVSVRLNMLHGKVNPEKFAKLYEEMARKYGAENLQNLMGFVDKDLWGALVSGMSAGLRATGLPKEIADKFEAEAGSVDTVDDLGKILQRLMDEYGDTLTYNFMVFSHGGRDHVYVVADDETFKLARAVAEGAKTRCIDVNLAFRALLKDWEKTLDGIGWDSGEGSGGKDF